MLAKFTGVLLLHNVRVCFAFAFVPLFCVIFFKTFVLVENSDQFRDVDAKSNIFYFSKVVETNETGSRNKCKMYVNY